MGIGISLSGLSSAVANRGGVGVISTAGIGLIFNDTNVNYRKNSIDALRKKIRKARVITTGILGVNINENEFKNVIENNQRFSFAEINM
jgi:nitronate monooxygenase